jgi:glycosyltransferase involved in cell wall biosynthesis
MNILAKGRLFLIFNGRFPSEKAASLFAAKSCEAFAHAGFDVSLIVPRRMGCSMTDAFVYYHLQRNFTVHYIPTIDLFAIPLITHIAFYVNYFVFSIFVYMYLLVKSEHRDIIYSNESAPLFLISFVRRNVYYELHDMPRGKISFFRMFFKRVRGIVVTNTWKMERLVQDFCVARERMLVEMNAVDMEEFDIPDTRAQVRDTLGLSVDDKIVLYTGHLYSWKGVETLAEAAKILLPEIKIYFVGGTANDVKNFKARFGDVSNIVIIGYRPHTEMPLWQKAADVVVVPNTATEKISKYDTSPMKIFEYMVSRTPIVATDLPSIREILNNTNALIVPPDDPARMARGIEMLLKDHSVAQQLASQAYTDVQDHTWDMRAQRIIAFIHK